MIFTSNKTQRKLEFEMNSLMAKLEWGITLRNPCVNHQDVIESMECYNEMFV